MESAAWPSGRVARAFLVSDQALMETMPRKAIRLCNVVLIAFSSLLFQAPAKADANASPAYGQQLGSVDLTVP
jgi:hypothetical protein